MLCRMSAYSRTFVSLFLINKTVVFNGEQEMNRARMGPRDHRLFSLGKPLDAKRLFLGRNFLSHSHTHDRFLFYLHWYLIPAIQNLFFHLQTIDN